MESKNINRRNFMGLSLVITALPSLALSEERKFNPKLKGWAIQDPSNKQNVSGFVYIPTIWGEQLKIPDALQIRNLLMQGIYLNLRRANIGFVEAINKYTNINAYSDAHLYLSSNKLMEYPFIYITTDKAFEFTKTERDNFENYLRNGGFALLESLEPELDYSQAEASLKQMMRDVLKKDVRFLPISFSHDIYHCFFDFNEGAPQGTELNWMIKSQLGREATVLKNYIIPKYRPYLEGIFLDDRLVAVYSGKGYGRKWKDIANNEPQQKMAVNFVVYALTQKGGIAQKIKY